MITQAEGCLGDRSFLQTVCNTMKIVKTKIAQSDTNINIIKKRLLVKLKE